MDLLNIRRSKWSHSKRVKTTCLITGMWQLQQNISIYSNSNNSGIIENEKKCRTIRRIYTSFMIRYCKIIVFRLRLESNVSLVLNSAAIFLLFNVIDREYEWNDRIILCILLHSWSPIARWLLLKNVLILARLVE